MGRVLARVATVLSADVEVIYRPLIMVQIIGITLTIIMAVILGMREKRRIIAEHGALVSGAEANHVAENADEKPLNPKLFWANVAIFIAPMIVLFANLLPPAFVFMLGTSVALLVNYRTPKEQIACINANAGGAIMMATIILATGTFLGTLKGAGMLDSISKDLVSILPQALLPNLHYVTGFFGVPLELVLSTDAYYFGLFPVVEQITTDVGVEPAKSGYAVMIGSIVGTFVSPFSPALWMGLGLANLSMGKHIRYSFFWIWGLSLAIMFCSWVIGVI